MAHGASFQRPCRPGLALPLSSSTHASGGPALPAAPARRPAPAASDPTPPYAAMISPWKIRSGWPGAQKLPFMSLLGTPPPLLALPMGTETPPPFTPPSIGTGEPSRQTHPLAAASAGPTEREAPIQQPTAAAASHTASASALSRALRMISSDASHWSRQCAAAAACARRPAAEFCSWRPSRGPRPKSRRQEGPRLGRTKPCGQSGPAPPGGGIFSLGESRDWSGAGAAPSSARNSSDARALPRPPWGRAGSTTHGGRPPVIPHSPSAASNAGHPGQHCAAPPGRSLQPEPPQAPQSAAQQKRPSVLRRPAQGVAPPPGTAAAGGERMGGDQSSSVWCEGWCEEGCEVDRPRVVRLREKCADVCAEGCEASWSEGRTARVPLRTAVTASSCARRRPAWVAVPFRPPRGPSAAASPPTSCTSSAPSASRAPSSAHSALTSTSHCIPLLHSSFAAGHSSRTEPVDVARAVGGSSSARAPPRPNTPMPEAQPATTSAAGTGAAGDLPPPLAAAGACEELFPRVADASPEGAPAKGLKGKAGTIRNWRAA
eukprot:scaffold2002_cov96-Isochrysis_galbana.AAC.3